MTMLLKDIDQGSSFLMISIVGNQIESRLKNGCFISEGERGNLFTDYYLHFHQPF